MSIVRHARLVICEDCGMHCHIVYSDMSTTREYYNKESALKEITDAYASGKLLPIEVGDLRNAIGKSNLPKTEQQYQALIHDLKKHFGPNPEMKETPKSEHSAHQKPSTHSN